MKKNINPYDLNQVAKFMRENPSKEKKKVTDNRSSHIYSCGGKNTVVEKYKKK